MVKPAHLYGEHMAGKPIRKKDALRYHEFPKPGKFEISPTVALGTQRDLALAYSPGVAEPCLEIAKNPEDVFRYTNKGNLVAVISNGSATLGLGNIGPLACKPVMEGKAILFKHLAGIDTFDIELDAADPDVFITCVKAMEPTFGGINLEDIKAPECFYIEETLRKTMNIPVFHDDQHGTAIIVTAALINAVDIQGKKLDGISVVFSGAGAAAVAVANLFVQLGVRRESITMCDIHGVIYTGREIDMDKYKGAFAQDTDQRTLAEAMVGKDVFVGLSVGNIVSQEMVKSMAKKPVVFPLANPTSEISYPDVMAVIPDAVVATGRSDFPNQVNNVLGFPYLFRGALDVGARTINERMKEAAVRAIAQLAKEDTPETVLEAYGASSLRYGQEYIIPKPFDPRVLLRVAPEVARAASESGVARNPLTDMEEYRNRLEKLQGRSKGVVRLLIKKAKQNPKRILFPEGDVPSILHAAQVLIDEGIATPILMGPRGKIEARIIELELDLQGAEIFDLREDPKREEMVQAFYKLRQRKGVSLAEAHSVMKHRENYAMMMVHEGREDGLVTGTKKKYSDSVIPALEIIGTSERFGRAVGVYIVFTPRGPKFFADTTVNIDPSAKELAKIAIHTADFARTFDVEPKIAMLSFSNFGQSNHPHARKVAKATKIIKRLRPDLIVDGEMQGDTALDAEHRDIFSFTDLTKNANILIFPTLDAGNIAYKLVAQLSRAELIGPVLLGMNRPVNVLERGTSVNSIVNLTVLTVLQAHNKITKK